ncbi:hypothetical protein CSOJ01_15309 [Colletotrichum sojae]|uniref:Uncharacterized protein n=1 Tax=Colletotrichum sojae TaxID=2175907 RepID=A0A8H6MIA6_9PEZI|nr:hypothetical protein CSOJ01_15309 [Colletotrichum sojae]
MRGGATSSRLRVSADPRLERPATGAAATVSGQSQAADGGFGLLAGERFAVWGRAAAACHGAGLAARARERRSEGTKGTKRAPPPRGTEAGQAAHRKVSFPRDKVAGNGKPRQQTANGATQRSEARQGQSIRSDPMRDLSFPLLSLLSSGRYGDGIPSRPKIVVVRYGETGGV